MLDAALDCVITIDDDGRVVEFNPAAERTFGYRGADVVGREMAELIVPPELRERHRAGFARYLETGEPTMLDRRLELTGMRADGIDLPGRAHDHADRRARRTPASPATCATSPSARRPRTSCARRARGSWRPPTPRAAGSSATCTTARSSGSWSSRSAAADGARADRRRSRRAARAPGRGLEELTEATAELRELARGIHPAVAHRGRPAAGARRRSSSARSVPAELTSRCRTSALPGAGRGGRVLHRRRGAHERRPLLARRARWRSSAAREDGACASRSRDDGRGGADPLGARGCAAWPTGWPRSTAALSVESPPGRGTVVRAEIPCAS